MVNRLTDWPENSPRRVSINSFGFGGTNAHIIVETLSEYEGKGHRNNSELNQRYLKGKAKSREHHILLCMSAESQGSLTNALDRLLHYVLPHTQDSNENLLSDLAYTLGSHRSQLPWRWTASASSMEQLARVLKERQPSIERAESRNSVAFAFTGQGAQWHNMGRELLQCYPAFKNSMREADQILTSLGAPWSLFSA